MHALIVDDSRAARSLVRRVVEPLGFEVAEAGHGEEALEQISPDNLPDVILVDWNMPTMDGLTMVRAVRAVREYAGIPIVMVSSENDPKQMARALMAGADDYLVKPVDEDMMRDKLEMLGILAGATP